LTRKPKTLQQLTDIVNDLFEQVYTLRGAVMGVEGYLNRLANDVYDVKGRIQSLSWSETGDIVEDVEGEEVIDPRKLQKRKKKYEKMKGVMYR